MSKHIYTDSKGHEYRNGHRIEDTNPDIVFVNGHYEKTDDYFDALNSIETHQNPIRNAYSHDINVCAYLCTIDSNASCNYGITFVPSGVVHAYTHTKILSDKPDAVMHAQSYHEATQIAWDFFENHPLNADSNTFWYIIAYNVEKQKEYNCNNILFCNKTQYYEYKDIMDAKKEEATAK